MTTSRRKILLGISALPLAAIPLANNYMGKPDEALKPASDGSVSDIIRDVQRQNNVISKAALRRPAHRDLPRSEANVPRVYPGKLGVNWFGLETEAGAPHGLWVKNSRTVPQHYLHIKTLGFSAVRIPVSAHTLHGNATPDWAQAVGYPDKSLSGLGYMLEEAGKAGLTVSLVLSNFDPTRQSDGQVGKPYGPCSPSVCAGGEYTVQNWLADLELMAKVTTLYPGVVTGIEIWNEPHKLSWNEWARLAERGGRAVLNVNPKLDILVNGVGGKVNNAHLPDGSTGTVWAHWGENFAEAVSNPIRLPKDRLVLAVHTYSPQFITSTHDYFKPGKGFPETTPEYWDLFFGHAAKAGYRVQITEFAFGDRYGSSLSGRELTYADLLFWYKKDRGLEDPAFFWSWNPNSDDTLGILEKDWKTPRADILSRLFPPA